MGSRLTFALALLVLVGQWTGAWTALSAEAPCVAACPEDDTDGECPPGCEACACCGSPRTMPPLPGSGLPPLPVAECRRISGDALPPPPEPREILHVPKDPAA